jgi:hypothetical protein
MMTGWQKVFSTQWAYQADIVKAVLEDRGFSAVIINLQDSSHHLWGEHEVHVPLADVLPAIKIIQDEIRFE